MRAVGCGEVQQQQQQPPVVGSWCAVDNAVLVTLAREVVACRTIWHSSRQIRHQQIFFSRHAELLSLRPHNTFVVVVFSM